MSRRARVVTALVIAWVAGSVFGSLDAQPAARATVQPQVLRAHAAYVPSLNEGQPVFVLVAGSDARPGDDPARSLADSIHVVALDAEQRRATIVGIPRDAWVEIPDVGMAKINSAMARGGPPLLILTVEELMGVRIKYFALATFSGLSVAVDAVGGLAVEVPCAMYDQFSRSDFEPGGQHMSGDEVLAFSRDRHSFPEGDLARSENGGRVLVGALAEFQRQFSGEPGRFLTWLAAGLTNIQTDVPLWELALLAFTASQVDPSQVQNIVLPTTSGTEGSLYVEYVKPSARAILADLARDGGITPGLVPDSPTAGCNGGTS